MRKLLVTLLLAAVVRAEPTTQDASSLPTFTAAVDVVPISAVVRDSRGRLVTTLRAPDFEVFDNGEPRRLVDFQIDRSSAITLAVLVDTSGSMRVGPKLTVARQVVSQLTSRLQAGRDEVGLFTFDSALHEQLPFTVYPMAIDATLSRAEPFGSTSLYDAIGDTAERLGARPSLHRAIVVLTDGLDTSSTLTPAEVSALASSIDVPVYVVATVPAIDRPSDGATTSARRESSSGNFRDLAQWTGGAVMWTSSEGDAAITADMIVSELRHQYLMAIESSNEGGWRPLDIRVRDRRLAVRARSGYFGRETSTPR